MMMIFFFLYVCLVIVGEAIEEPTMIVRGEGAGSDCEAPAPMLDLEIGEAVEEPVMFFYGEGSGRECDTGNPGEDTDKEEKSESSVTTPTTVPNNVPNQCVKEQLSDDSLNSSTENCDDKTSPTKSKFKPTLGVQVIPKSAGATSKRLSRWDVGKPEDDNKTTTNLDDNNVAESKDLQPTAKVNEGIFSATEEPTSKPNDLKQPDKVDNEIATDVSQPDSSESRVEEGVNQEQAMPIKSLVASPPRFFFGPNCVSYPSKTETPVVAKEETSAKSKDETDCSKVITKEMEETSLEATKPIETKPSEERTTIDVSESKTEEQQTGESSESEAREIVESECQPESTTVEDQAASEVEKMEIPPSREETMETDSSLQPETRQDEPMEVEESTPSTEGAVSEMEGQEPATGASIDSTKTSEQVSKPLEPTEELESSVTSSEETKIEVPISTSCEPERVGGELKVEGVVSEKSSEPVQQTTTSEEKISETSLIVEEKPSTAVTKQVESDIDEAMEEELLRDSEPVDTKASTSEEPQEVSQPPAAAVCDAKSSNQPTEETTTCESKVSQSSEEPIPQPEETAPEYSENALDNQASSPAEISTQPPTADIECKPEKQVDPPISTETSTENPPETESSVEEHSQVSGREEESHEPEIQEPVIENHESTEVPPSEEITARVLEDNQRKEAVPLTIENDSGVKEEIAESLVPIKKQGEEKIEAFSTHLKEAFYTGDKKVSGIIDALPEASSLKMPDISNDISMEVKQVIATSVLDNVEAKFSVHDKFATNIRSEEKTSIALGAESHGRIELSSAKQQLNNSCDVNKIPEETKPIVKSEERPSIPLEIVASECDEKIVGEKGDSKVVDQLPMEQASFSDSDDDDPHSAVSLNIDYGASSDNDEEMGEDLSKSRSEAVENKVKEEKPIEESTVKPVETAQVSLEAEVKPSSKEALPEPTEPEKVKIKIDELPEQGTPMKIEDSATPQEPQEPTNSELQCEKPVSELSCQNWKMESDIPEPPTKPTVGKGAKAKQATPPTRSMATRASRKRNRDDSTESTEQLGKDGTEEKTKDEGEDESQGGHVEKKIKLRGKRAPDVELRKAVEESRGATASSEDEATKTKEDVQPMAEGDVSGAGALPVKKPTKSRPRGRKRRGYRGIRPKRTTAAPATEPSADQSQGAEPGQEAKTQEQKETESPSPKKRKKSNYLFFFFF